ncbi:MAG: HAD hydrolase family protein [Candidatus Cloacimonetes bacterium]|nr:HAD hydrolase family protein [Candidatus Cloacimonadota bacterium]
MKDFKKIKLLVCDCDGVLTDGLIVYDSHSAELKNFSAHDGLGIKMLKHTDIQVAVITGRYSKMLERRCQDLEIRFLFQNIQNKKRCLIELLQELCLGFENVAYIGDDWNDYLAMQDCLIKIAPKNAPLSFQKTVDHITENPGGYGAVRDAIEYILQGKNDYEKTLMLFLEDLNKM